MQVVQLAEIETKNFAWEILLQFIIAAMYTHTHIHQWSTQFFSRLYSYFTDCVPQQSEGYLQNVWSGDEKWRTREQQKFVSQYKVFAFYKGRTPKLRSVSFRNRRKRSTL